MASQHKENVGIYYNNDENRKDESEANYLEDLQVG
jgi:hypothetical protein